MINKLKLFFTGDNRSANVKKNILGSIFIKGISMVVSFMLVPLTIGYVSSELYGVWLTISSVLAWLSFLDVGFSQGLKNKLTEAIALNDWERGKSLVSTCYFMMLLIFIPICIILECIIPFIDWTSLLNVSSQYTVEIVKAMYVLVAFACVQMIVNVVVSVVAAFQMVALSGTFSVIGNVVSLGIIYLLTKTCPPSLVVLALTLAVMPIVVTFIASVILFKGKFKAVSPSYCYVNKKYIKELFGLGYKFFILNIQVVVLYQSTNILISNVSSPNEVTTYNIAYKLLSCAMMIYTLITAPLWPAYTDAYARKDFDWMKQMRSKMQKILILSIFACVLIVLASSPIYHFWIGNTVHVPFRMTIFVAIYVVIYCWMSLNGTLLVGMGKIQVATGMALAGMILHIPLSLLFGKYIGAYGVILSLIFINMFYAIIMSIQVQKILNKKAYGIWNI